MRSATAFALFVLGAAGVAHAQSTGMPSFHAPYRAFDVREFGGTMSFPDGGGVSFEGQYRFGFRAFDLGFRGGFFGAPEGQDTELLIGVSARQRIITHSTDFPLDGSVIVGLGGRIVDNGSIAVIPVGLSLGRRLNLEDSDVSIVPYAQPTMFITSGRGDTDLNIVLGLGADVRLSSVFDARISIGLGDLEGISISAMWVR